MPGTRVGGLKTAATNKARYGENFYANIGRKGGENGHDGGFAAVSKEKRIAAGRKGGQISSRAEDKPPLWQRRKMYNQRQRANIQEPPKEWLKQFEEKRRSAERSRNETV